MLADAPAASSQCSATPTAAPSVSASAASDREWEEAERPTAGGW